MILFSIEWNYSTVYRLDRTAPELVFEHMVRSVCNGSCLFFYEDMSYEHVSVPVCTRQRLFNPIVVYENIVMYTILCQWVHEVVRDLKGMTVPVSYVCIDVEEREAGDIESLHEYWGDLLGRGHLLLDVCGHSHLPTTAWMNMYRVRVRESGESTKKEGWTPLFLPRSNARLSDSMMFMRMSA